MSSWNVVNDRNEPMEYEEPDMSKFYNEADMLEDAVLFPEQTVSGTVGGLFRGHETSMQDFLSKGLDWTRFIQDLETDEEYEDSDAETGDFSEDESLDEESGESSEDKDKRLVKRKNQSHESRDDADSEADLSTSESGRSPLISDEERQDMALMKNWKAPRFEKEDVKKAFYTFLDREKSKGERTCCAECRPSNN